MAEQDVTCRACGHDIEMETDGLTDRVRLSKAELGALGEMFQGDGWVVYCKVMRYAYAKAVHALLGAKPGELAEAQQRARALLDRIVWEEEASGRIMEAQRAVDDLGVSLDQMLEGDIT